MPLFISGRLNPWISIDFKCLDWGHLDIAGLIWVCACAVCMLVLNIFQHCHFYISWPKITFTWSLGSLQHVNQFNSPDLALMWWYDLVGPLKCWHLETSNWVVHGDGMFKGFWALGCMAQVCMLFIINLLPTITHINDDDAITARIPHGHE